MRAYVFPGQGAQVRGMGAGLFGEFEAYTAVADRVLGYSIEALCSSDPEGRLQNTAFAQPALYVVCALAYLKKQQQDPRPPNYLAGHSLGEYAALFAAGAFDFATGLRLVHRRGELMSRQNGGAMAAVLSVDPAELPQMLRDARLDDVDIANFNSPSQTVLSGPGDAMARASDHFKRAGVPFVPLRVSASFHSRSMRSTAEAFARTLADVPFGALRVPVISNVSARPHEPGSIRESLARQIYHPVRWTETIQFLSERGVVEIEEIGPGRVLTKLTAEIRKARPALTRDGANGSPLGGDGAAVRSAARSAGQREAHRPETAPPRAEPPGAQRLGAESFRSAYGVRYAYASGSMYKAIASRQLVVKMAQAGMLSFYGSGGVPPATLEADLRFIRTQLEGGEPFGMNLLSSPSDPDAEMAVVNLLLAHGVRNVEASAYVQVSPALVRYRLQGLSEGGSGRALIGHRVMAKISRPEVADAFLRPAPARIVEGLVRQGLVSVRQAELAAGVPMADDLCVEADSGGHTDAGNLMVLLPSIMRLRDRVCGERRAQRPVRVGAAGGLGTPEAIAMAFVLGAEFVLTGSINQCSVEAGTSDDVKDMLARLDVPDTAYAPAGDMFELGAKIQVMSKGVFFPARANRLHELWRNHGAWEQIDRTTRDAIESKYFKRSFDTVYADVCAHYERKAPATLEEAERNPKHKMALVFRWYFAHTARLAQAGDSSERVNYQVHTGPALGAFNQWVKGTELEHWRNRHVDDMGLRLMAGAARVLETWAGAYRTA
ncbi:MAG: ACP S-malonyltransferase [Polyangiaceae bacterium]|nr:ACP S-malonyltransferase [Polyangiaceae bacterium]